MTDDAELLVTVEMADPKNEDSPVTVQLTTDMEEPLVLHWGVRRAGKHDDWSRPADSIVPMGTCVFFFGGGGGVWGGGGWMGWTRRRRALAPGQGARVCARDGGLHKGSGRGRWFAALPRLWWPATHLSPIQCINIALRPGAYITQ